MSADKRLGKYDIQAPLGKGTHATVYRALDTQFDRLVAVKVLPREALEPRALEPFRKYAQSLVRLRHPGIARFIEMIETGRTLCLVWELAEGKPLSSLMKSGAHPEPKDAWEITRQILEALAYAHGQGAAHRDLKPGNVMLAANGHVTLTDFGSAILVASPGDTVHYLAPEHFERGRITPASDLYQVGVIVYQMVTGKLPFTGKPEEIAHRVMQERPTDPSAYNNRLAWQLDWVVQKAVSKDPAERFSNAIEFADGLRLGLQDTVGVPLEPAKPPQKVAAAPAAAVPPNVLQNAKVIAEKKAAPPQPAPKAAPPAPVRTPVTPMSAAPRPAAAPPVAKPVAAAPAPAAPPVAKPVAAAPAPAAAPDAPASAEDPRKPRILFVDDDARILNGLRTMLRQEYNVLTAENGDAALEMVKAGRVHVVVSDQRMPGLTGVELLRKVRSVAPNTVRILLTGYTDLAALVGSINEGEIFRFVKKPWDNDELRKALADAAKIAMELAGTSAPKAASPRSAGSLLVIDPGQGIARGLERLLAGAARVRLVATPAEAAKVLAREEIAAIVADMGAGMDGLVALFRELKAKRPEVLSILLTDEPDSELAIELINRAQIFRFLPKPVNARELRTQVATALRRYAAFKQIPVLKDSVAGKQPALAERARALVRTA